jgi:hypothetical protein
MGVARFFPAFAAAFALLIGGCGGDGGDGGVGGGAELAPRSTKLFLTVRTDFEGAEWRNAEALTDRLPIARRAIREFLGALERDGIDFERDVKPALGDELDFVVFDGPGTGDEHVVALTQPRDAAKLETLAEKDDAFVYELIDDWAAMAEDEDDLAAFTDARKGDSLADDDRFEAATDGLPEDALVAGYMNGASLLAELARDAGSDDIQETLSRALVPDGQAPSVGFAVEAEDEGLRVDADFRFEDAGDLDEYEAELPSEVPAGAVVYVSWRDAAAHLRDALRRAGEENADFDRYVAQAELALGVSLERDVLPLFEGEGAVAVYAADEPGDEDGPTPVVALVLEVEDEDAAVETLDRLVERASALLGSVEETEDVEIAGVRARTVSLDRFDLVYAAFDGKLVVATAEEAIADIRGTGDRLTDDPAYRETREAAEAPDESVGFVFVNVDSFADAAAAEDPVLGSEFDGLGPLFLNGSAEDDEVAVDGFLRVE